MVHNLLKTFNACKFAFDYIRKYGPDKFRELLENAPLIREKFDLQGLYQYYEIQNTPMGMTPKEIAQAFRYGNLDARLVAQERNKIMDVFKSAIIAQMVGGATAAQDLEVDYMALGLADTNSTTGVAPTTADTQLTAEEYRSTLTEDYESVGSYVGLLYLDASTANLSTATIASVTSTTQFTVGVGEAANIAAGHRIRVFTTAYETVTVQGVAGDVITLKSSTPLSTTLNLVGKTVQRMYGEVGLFCGAATGIAKTGTLVNHAKLEFAKPASPSTSGLCRVQLKYITAT